MLEQQRLQDWDYDQDGVGLTRCWRRVSGREIKKNNCRVVKQEAVHVCSRFHKETVAGVEEEE